MPVLPNPKIPEHEHTLVNEAGRRYKHEGYMSATCPICGAPFLLAKSLHRQYNDCGRHK